MFNILKNITKATIGVAILPIDVAADIVTLGAAMTDKERPYTAERLSKVMDNLNEATKSDKSE
jgi:hypothetical protein